MEILKGRLESETPPGNYYELLELAWFIHEREAVLASVKRATRFLHQYQNHKNPDVVQRARNLQLQCASAGHTFSDDQKWSAYDSALMTSLREEYLKSKSSVDPAIWLGERCQIVPNRIDEVIKFIGAASNPRMLSTRVGGDTHSDQFRLPTLQNPPFDIDQYEVVERLGEGGIGVVYRARHRQLDKLFALKLLRTDKSVDRNAASRFQREMKAIGKLDHPNIVRATDAGLYANAHYLVMELIEGQNLHEVVRSRGPLPVVDVCQIIQQVGLGLQHAFERGIVHRDIKPSNLMLSPNGNVKILDLGLALLIPDINQTLQAKESVPDSTADGLIVGTIDFMAPEQRNGRQHVDARSDVYSLGCTMYYLLTGRIPFFECGDDIFVRLAAHATNPIPSISRIRNDVPEKIEAIMRRMLAKIPAERFPSGGEVAAAISEELKSISNQQSMKVSRPTNHSQQSPVIAGSAAVDRKQSKPLPPPVVTGRLNDRARIGSKSSKEIPIPQLPARRGEDASRNNSGARGTSEIVTGRSAPAANASGSNSVSGSNQSLPILRPGISEPNSPRSPLMWVTIGIVVFTVMGLIFLLAQLVRMHLHHQHSETAKSVSRISTQGNPCKVRSEQTHLPFCQLHWDRINREHFRG